MRRAIVLSVLLAACGRSPPVHPHVLVVTIDTLRPDAVGPGTPAIHAFLGEATRFRKARTVAPLTLPAHASIFTGLLPSGHGIHDNVSEPLPPREKRSFPLLAEQFKDAGYATAAFVARSVLAAPTGIGSGFDVYDCPASESELQEEGGSVPGEERVRAAISWIEAAPRGKPWFVWVHLFDPHAPYLLYGGDAQRSPTRETDSQVARYAGDVRRADAALELLLRAVGPETVVVLASDHGEGLMAHGEPTHGPLCYGSTIDAVLAVRAPGFERGAVDEGLRCVADVAPTLRRLCSLPPLEGDARDLGGPPHETLVAESLFTWWIHGWGQVFSVTDGDFSLVESGNALELFDRRRDPGETKPLDLSHPAYEKLDRALERFRGRRWGGAKGELLASVPPYGELRRHDTGYLERRANAALPNPRDHLWDWAAIENVPPLIQVCAARRDPAPLEAALKSLGEIERRIPGSPRVDHYRAMLHGAIAHMTGVPARFSDAARAELAAIEKGYVQKETIAPAIRYCAASGDSDALRALVRLLNGSGRKLDPETGRALADAMTHLSVGEQVFYSFPSR
jgi:arylsulfatase A-like enzyme